jgi:hypothetical protein
MPKALRMIGTHYQTGSLKMYVELDGELIEALCQKTTNNSWLSTLKSKSSFPEGATFIMPVDHTKPITIAIFYVLKRILEKNGQQ